jgi:hypothetical protein
VITTGANKIADADVIMVVSETAAVAEATTVGLSKVTAAYTTTALKSTVANKKEVEEAIIVVAETEAIVEATTALQTTRKKKQQLSE